MKLTASDRRQLARLSGPLRRKLAAATKTASELDMVQILIDQDKLATWIEGGMEPGDPIDSIDDIVDDVSDYLYKTSKNMAQDYFPGDDIEVFFQNHSYGDIFYVDYESWDEISERHMENPEDPAVISLEDDLNEKLINGSKFSKLVEKAIADYS